jgi:RNA 3'-terminal phosphate cyclase (ATP)
MLVIDGAEGEGGGQVLRTSLALALVTQTPFRLENIRARRAKPGLQRQHLTAVLAAARVGNAQVRGATLGSGVLDFQPGPIRGGDYHFPIGTAGSATLVAQTLLPALLRADGPARVVIEGGTYNPLAPTFGFLDRVFLPLLRRMGADVTLTLERPGFHPVGGGRIVLTVQPSPLQPLSLCERGEPIACVATAMVSRLPIDIARRELDVVGRRLGWRALHAREVAGAGPGNVLELEVSCAHVTELVSSVGERGVRAETVAARACDEVERWLAAGVPVGEHLADQLLLPMAMAGEGELRTLPPSGHTRTQMEIVRQFLDTPFDVEAVTPMAWRIAVGRR